MKRLLDKVVVVDVESTCWDGSPPHNQLSDIIEIGSVLLDTKTGTIEDTKEAGNTFIWPSRSLVSAFCTSLTTITPEMVLEAPDLTDALSVLSAALKTKERVWASYGDYDRIKFEGECRDKNIPYPFGPRHINVKTLAALRFGWERELGMAVALERLGIPLEGKHHRAGDDAKNIAKILARTLW
jgi:inhibitor of KinA sporulation pathway (predicted exonuclease)